MYDIIVVGGGPAGMTAALYGLRNGKSVLVIEKAGFGGQITHSPKVENYPGTLSMSGNEFADRMLDQILAQGAEIEFEMSSRLIRKTAERSSGPKKGAPSNQKQSCWQQESSIVCSVLRVKKNWSEKASRSVLSVTETSTQERPYAWQAAETPHCRKRSCCRRSAKK